MEEDHDSRTIWILLAAAAAPKSLQLCPTLCDPCRTDSSPPGSPVPGILQARTLEWVAIAFSVGSYLASFKTKNPEQCLAHASY